MEGQEMSELNLSNKIEDILADLGHEYFSQTATNEAIVSARSAILAAVADDLERRFGIPLGSAKYLRTQAEAEG